MDANLAKQTEALAQEIACQATTLEDLNGLMRTLMKSALERMLDTEMEVHLGRTPSSVNSESVGSVNESSTPKKRNRRNGHSSKTIQGDMGKLPLEIPRDRAGSFEPQLIGKHQRRLAGFDEKILALYAKGMTTRDIQNLVQDLYGVDVSPTLISEITADLEAEVRLGRRDDSIRSGRLSISMGSWSTSAANRARFPNTRCMWRLV